MVASITLTSSMRSNLSSLKSLASQMSTTQTRLSTGKKVNNAIDNANSYYQSRALTNRASDLDMLLDSMGQSIQTITTAATAIDKSMSLFEQMSSIAQDATVVMGEDIKKIDSTMSTLQIQQILNQGGIISLQDDITITDTLNINISGTTIVGNGHSITYEGSYGFSDPTVNGKLVNKFGDAAINIVADSRISGLTINYSNTKAQGAAMTIAGARALVDNLTINGTTTANRLYGIQVAEGGKLTLDSTENIHLSGDYAEKIVNGNPNLWAGEYNTDTIVNQMEADNIAAYACKNFAPTLSLLGDAEFGQGTWYLPSIGELCDTYGYNYEAIDMTTGGGTTGAVGDNKTVINNALTTLSSKGVEAATLTNSWYWSSSESTSYNSWVLSMSNGNRTNFDKNPDCYVRAFQLLENCFTPLSLSSNAASPQIGDVMYADKTYGKASEYDGSKTAVGVITWVSDDGASAKIMSLKNLSVSVNADTGWQEFDANNPYGGTNGTMKWQNTAYYYDDDAGRHYVGTNITGVNDYYYSTQSRLLSHAMNWRGEVEVTNTQVEALDVSTQKYGEEFNEVLSQYDAMVKDAAYQGINLLNGGNLRVMFNETRTHSHQVEGYHADSNSLGVNSSHWETLSDVKTSIAQLQAATSTLRNIAEALGNHLSIIETRMNFTDGLVDVLQTGADDLVLADMNEESANYLALQTRNNLAVNALALAAQSNNAVLKLF